MSTNSCSTSAKLSRSAVAALLAAWLAAWLPAVGAALPAAVPDDGAPWRQALPQARPLGDGDLTWFGLRIYHATLWAAQRPFDPAQPFALQLSYYRNISRSRLVNTSMDEIRRLNGSSLDDSILARWQSMLTSAFVDVAAGDQLIGVYLPRQGMQLYDGHRLLAQLDDPALARAFFDIWLNPRSRDASLRRQLLGAAP